MRNRLLIRFFSVGTALVLSSALCPVSVAQSTTSAPAMAPEHASLSSSVDVALPDAPDSQASGQPEKGPNTTELAVNKGAPAAKQQPKRIMGIMPNYRAVSAGEVPPPPGPKQSFKIATQNSFDYSSFVFVGMTSLIAEAQDAHPKLGKGVSGFWGYSWRGFVDKTDGNYWVIFALPTVFHEDSRFYTKGEGPLFKRGVYAASRILITRNYDGNETINASELLGRGAAQSISLSYYPSSDRSASALAEKYAYALLRDAATNMFREFWPDITAHLRRHPSQ